VIYLYKYSFKEASKATPRLTNADHVSDNDEITLYIRGRYLCSGNSNNSNNITYRRNILALVDAMWRTLGYRTYPSPDPAVYVIKAKQPADVEELLLKNKCCDLIFYFNRPMLLRNMKYTEFFNDYKWGYSMGARHQNEDLAHSGVFG